MQITEDWVLTAKHVSFVVGSSFSDGFGSSTVAARFDLGPGAFPANDLALLRLSTPIDDGAGVTLLANVIPFGVYAPLPVTITSGKNHGAGLRGYAVSELREVWDSADDGSGPVPVNYLVTYNATKTAPYVQGGDSGGGLFLGAVTDSTTPLLGITSAQLQDAGGHPFGSAFVQIAAYRSWIDGTITGQGDAAPNWVTQVPEPATCALMLAGLAVFGLATRRRQQR